MPGLDLLINALEAHDCQPRQFGQKWRARCPSHKSRGPSLEVVEGRVAPMVNCYAGCDWREVFDSLGIKWGDLKPDDWKPTPKPPKPRERHLEAAVRYGAQPVRVGEGVYNGRCACGGDLYVGRAGAACDRGCRISIDPVEPHWESPVELARAFGCDDLKPTGEGVFVGTCPSCRGWLSAGPEGAFCESNCPVEGVGSVVRSLRDLIREKQMQERTLEILGCIEDKRGISQKTGREWVLYQVHANDEQGNPIEQKLKSFDNLPQGKGTYYVEARESQYGTEYTVKRSLSPQDRQHNEVMQYLQKIVTMVQAMSPVPPATAAAQAPVAKPHVVPAPETSEVPF